MVNLQAQLACLKEQAAQNFVNGSAATENPNEKYLYGKPSSSSLSQELQNWFQSENSSNMVPQFNPNLNSTNSMPRCHENGLLDPNYSMGNSYGNSFDNFEEASHSNMSSRFDMQTDHNRQWANNYQDSDDLQSVAFGYIQH